MTGDARDAILARVTAVTERPVPAPDQVSAVAYRRRGELGRDACVELFCSRAGEYRARIERLAEPDVASSVGAACRERGVHRLVVPAGIPRTWSPEGVERVADNDLSARDLDGVDGTLTGCTVAIAETGTIVLSAGPEEGRRALTLVPDLHICVVRETQIVELVPEAFALVAEHGLERRPLTFVSGPSATSDIELSRVEGVHGPRSLVVLVVAGEP